MCSVSSAAARLLIQSRTLATSRSLSLVSPLCWSSRYSSKLGFFSFQLRKSVSARKLVVRAARTESKGASLGFRPPQFQLPEPLTGKMWKLEDFESYPALLSQDVARDFGAVCTPEFFLFKKDGRRPFELVYHGQFDDSRPSNNVPVTGRDLSLAIDRVLSAQPASSVQKPSSSHFSICQKCWMQHKVASRNKAVICDAVPFSCKGGLNHYAAILRIQLLDNNRAFLGRRALSDYELPPTYGTGWGGYSPPTSP
ncbi:uncharacterized protein LOC132273580 isoform X6 [Cornus florida]|uniref:uncharacterized protein LOC132273580 isoform X6 n=1 Tax=Cornus florida TaxID=4283 RepID=UPI00289FD449|nr:uncharacterized protein LOC132273580 isoform X6 [Cornus florida]